MIIASSDSLLQQFFTRLPSVSKDRSGIDTTGQKATIYQLTTMLSTSKKSYYKVITTC